MVEALNSPTVLPSQPLAHSHGTTRSVLHSAGNTSGAGCDVVHPGFDLKKTLFIYLFIYKKNIIPAQVNFVYQATKMLAFQRLYNVFKETCAELLNPIFDIKQ